MSKKKNNISPNLKTYPLSVSLVMIAVAILLSFVDLAFLNDVIGKVLDLGTVESLGIAFALGLVGIAIMAHQGIKEAHETVKWRIAAVHYLLWISLGIAFILIRFFSASIMQLDNSTGDDSLLSIFGKNVREVDVILAPLMLFLYIATGILAKDGFKNLLNNPEFDKWLESWKNSKRIRKSKEERLRAIAERKQAKLREEAERKQRQIMKEREEFERKQKAAEEEKRIKDALNGSYSNALAQYRNKEKEIKENYQRIYANISRIKTMDKQEKDFETKVKPNLLNIVQESVYSVQNNVALAIRKKSGEEITNFHSVIKAYNNERQEKNR